MTVTASGFSAQTYKEVHVVAGNQTPIKVSLSLGKEAQTVQVEGSASELINTESAQVETTISTEQLATAPVAGSMDNLALASPGVVWSRAIANSNTNGVNFSVNGQRGRSNNSEIDGQTNNDTSIGGPSFFFANQDAIQEVQFLTTNMGAQYGRNMGAISNYITKSGTNSLPWHAASKSIPAPGFPPCRKDRRPRNMGGARPDQTRRMLPRMVAI